MTADTVYNILEIISETSNGVISRVCRKNDSKKYLLKTIKSNDNINIAIDRLKKEFSLMKSLSHASIPKLYHLVEYQFMPAILMEDIDAVPLKERLLDKKPALTMFFDIAISLLESIQYLHYNKIIHCNIDPSLFYLDKNNNIRIIDLSHAINISETKDPNPGKDPNPYISPEQTGRIDYPLDRRTDIYSLGILFYELITGKPPFSDQDPVELVHSHLTIKPESPVLIDNSIPKDLSDIIMKILSKDPWDRYQSIYGILQDIITLKEIHIEKKEMDFCPGRHDLPMVMNFSNHPFHISNILHSLDTIFNDTRKDSKNIAIIKGEEGSGKSFLINYFLEREKKENNNANIIKVSFDKNKVKTPYFCLFEGIRKTLWNILQNDQKNINKWRQLFTNSLSHSSYILFDVIPELETIIAQKSFYDNIKYDISESINKFQSVLYSFITSFINSREPLIIVYEDIHFADYSSLCLLRSLIEDNNIKNLLIIASLRENDNPRIKENLDFIQNLENGYDISNTFALYNLQVEDIAEILNEIFQFEKDRNRQLAILLHKKTKGNRHSFSKLLSDIYNNGSLFFDIHRKVYDFDPDSITNIEISDDVFNIILRDIRNVSDELLNCLKIASCFIDTFDLNALLFLIHEEKNKIESLLNRAIRLEIIETLPLDDKRFQFCDEKIGSYINALLTKEERSELSLQIGKFLLDQIKKEKFSHNIFEMAEYFNSGIDNLKDHDDILDAISLNYRAGLKSMELFAYKQANEYFHNAINLLPDDSWQSLYQITYDIFNNLIKTYYYLSKISTANAYFKAIIDNVKNRNDIIKTYIIKISILSFNCSFAEAIETAKEALKILSIHIPNTEEGFLQEINGLRLENKKLLKGKTLEDLTNLPNIKDNDKILILQILTEIIPASYFSSQHLLLLIISLMLNITLKNGNSDYAPVSYALYAVLLVRKNKNLCQAYSMGSLALKMNSKNKNKHLYSKIYFLFSSFICHLKKHLKTSGYFAELSFESGLKYGDPSFSSFALGVSNQINYIIGNKRLEQLIDECNKNLDYLKQKGFEAWYYYQLILKAVLENLHQIKEDNTSLQIEDISEDTILIKLKELNFLSGIAEFYLHKGKLCFIFCRYKEALNIFNSQKKYIEYFYSSYNYYEYKFYHLISLFLYHIEENLKIPDTERSFIKNELSDLETLSKISQKNYLCRYLIANALLKIYHKDHNKAMELLDSAVKESENSGFPILQALAYEIYAKLFYKKDFYSIAERFIENAVNIYSLWGANNKVMHLKEQFTFSEISISELTKSIKKLDTIRNIDSDASLDIIDFSSLLKITQIISDEIVLDNLIVKLLKIIIKNAGAQLGRLILYQNDEHYLYATGFINKANEIITDYTYIDNNAQIDFPQILINNSISSGETICLDNAYENPKYRNDPYINKNRVLSVLCLPISLKGKLIALVYLENNSLPGAFTKNKIKGLQIMSAQIAISLKNALYVDELNKTKETLNKSRLNYKTLFENLQDLFYRIDMDGKINLISPSIEKILGYTQKDALILNIRNLFSDPSITQEFFKLILENKNINNYEVLMRKKNNEIIWVSINAHIIYDKNQNPVGIEGMIRNIDRIKKAEQELIEQKDKLSLILRSIQDAVVATDQKGNIILMNKVSLQYLKTDEKEAIGKPLGNIMIFTDSNTGLDLTPSILNTLNTGDISNYEYNTIISSKSASFPISLTVAPIMDKGVSIYGLLLIFRDITEKLKIDEELQKAQKIDTISVFASGIAHDFNNILTAIIGNLNLIKLKTDKSSKSYTKLEQMEKASYRAQNLTQQLMTFSRKGDPIKKPCNISNILKESAYFMLSGSKVKPEFEISQDLHIVNIDINQISQVINNLVINAMHAMPDGGILNIKASNITLEDNNPYNLQKGNYVEIIIKDNGIGIPEDIIHKIFDPFFTTKEKGNGLGLATSYSIIQKHNGHIRVESRENSGTAFYIYLPDSKEKLKIISDSDDINIQRFKGNALIMDNEEIILDITSQMLSTLGFKVLKASDSKQAIERFKYSLKPIDLIIMDLTVPGSIGAPETAREILKLNNNAKIILSSGYQNDPVMINYKDHGFSNIITKPYTLNDMIKAISEILPSK